MRYNKFGVSALHCSVSQLYTVWCLSFTLFGVSALHCSVSQLYTVRCLSFTLFIDLDVFGDQSAHANHFIHGQKCRVKLSLSAPWRHTGGNRCKIPLNPNLGNRGALSASRPGRFTPVEITLDTELDTSSCLAWSNASAAVEMNSSVFRVITRRKVV
jgi:hypothetical protein